MEQISKGRKIHLQLGRFGEDTAVRLLRSKGYHILTRNFRLKSGELDIVALDGTTVVFAEVKTRRQNRFSPRSNLSFRQLKRNFANKRHCLFCKTQKMKRQARGTTLVDTNDVKIVKQFLPYL